MSNPVLEELRWKKFSVLDKGHIFLVDAMGDDEAVCQAARISYGKGTRKVSEDRDLIRYLMRHHHMTPFEMCEVKLGVRVPMDCWRQWIRHRTANVNEYSTRYSEAIDAMQVTSPDGWRLQAKDNKQGSGETIPRKGPVGVDGNYLSNVEAEFHREARKVYEHRIRAGVSREQARKDLPLSTFTEAYWKCDLRNLLHFLALRMDSHAQQEIREYATTIGERIVAPLFPLCWEAFLDYQFGAVTLSRLDVEAVRSAVVGGNLDLILSHIVNKRERDECRDKLFRLGLPEEAPRA